jgi:hypothetical protein
MERDTDILTDLDTWFQDPRELHRTEVGEAQRGAVRRRRRKAKRELPEPTQPKGKQP